jgi:micrococcal nuclease
VDGDTIDVNLNGQIVRVRYIGMNTPESNEVCGSEATAANAALVAGRTVTMVRDVSETDRYGRLLRYVYVDGVFVNGELVAGGWADAVDYPPDTAQSGTLHSLMAQGAGRGCDLVAAPLPTQPAVEPAPTAPPQGGNCDPSYPDVCIAPPPPDLDCKDVPYKRFRVLAPDPHNFDGNHDGVGCEG